MNCIRLLRVTEKQCSVFKLLSARYASHPSMRFQETEERWQEKDQVSKRWELIYKAPMTKALNYASVYLTFTTGVIGATSLYYAGFVYNTQDANTPVVIGDDIVIASSPFECMVYLGVFIGLHVAIKILLSKYVIRLYRDGDEYLAIYRGHFYNSTQIHQFNINNFKKLKPTPLLPWSESKFSLGKKQGILLENYFKTPECFNKLLYKQDQSAEEDK